MKGDSKGAKFPVVCTSYEICMPDKKFLANYPWKFIVVVSQVARTSILKAHAALGRRTSFEEFQLQVGP